MSKSSADSKQTMAPVAIRHYRLALLTVLTSIPERLHPVAGFVFLSWEKTD